MNIFQRIFKGRRVYNIITDEMRARALETRRLNAQINQMEKRLETKERMNILEEAIKGESSGNKTEEMFMQMIIPLLTGANKSPIDAGITPTTNANPSIPVLQSQQIIQLAEQVKKKVPDDVLHYIKSVSNEDMIAIKEVLANE